MWAGLLLLNVAIAAQQLHSNDQCNHDLDRGSCDETFQVKWYYDRYGRRCREFYYGGCDGNGNRFDTKEECSRICHPLPDANDASQRCFLPFHAGEGAGDFERWYFDAQLGRCVCISWTGRGGNANLFYSHTHCMSICGAFAKENNGQQPRQQLPARDEPATRNRQAYDGRSGQQRLVQSIFEQQHPPTHSPFRSIYPSNFHASRPIDHLPIQTQSLSSDSSHPVYSFEQAYKFVNQQPKPHPHRPTKFKSYKISSSNRRHTHI